MKLLAKAHSEVKFARFAKDKTSLYVGQLHLRSKLHLPFRANLVLSIDKRANTQGVKPYVSALFSVSEVFAVAKVKLCYTQ